MSEWTLPDGDRECCACSGSELPMTPVRDARGPEGPMCWTCYRSAPASALGVSRHAEALGHLQTRHIIVGVLWANGMELAGVRRTT